jgi:hypothetical protein
MTPIIKDLKNSNPVSFHLLPLTSYFVVGLRIRYSRKGKWIDLRFLSWICECLFIVRSLGRPLSVLLISGMDQPVANFMLGICLQIGGGSKSFFLSFSKFSWGGSSFPYIPNFLGFNITWWLYQISTKTALAMMTRKMIATLTIQAKQRRPENEVKCHSTDCQLWWDSLSKSLASTTNKKSSKNNGKWVETETLFSPLMLT